MMGCYVAIKQNKAAVNVVKRKRLQSMLNEKSNSSSEKLEEGPQFLSSLKKEFSKETKVVKKIKASVRSKVCVEKTKYV